MIVKIELKGTVTTVTRVTSKTAENKTTRFQSLIITTPGWTDSFGEKLGEDKTWEIQLINDAIDKHDLLGKNLQGKKVTATCFLNSRGYMSSGEQKYMLSLSLKAVEVYQPKTN